MGAIIGTSTRVVGKFGTGPYGESLDGFSSGNLAGGIQPTQLSADWCDGVQQEIVNATIQYLPFALGEDYTDLAYAIDYQFVNTRPVQSFNPHFTFRTQSDGSLSGTQGANCLVTQRTQYNPSLAAGSVTTVGVLQLPTNCQALVSFESVVCQTDAMSTNYAAIEYRVSVRNAAGVITVQNSSLIYTTAPGIAYSYAISTSGSNVVLRLTVPAAPVGKIHNAFCHAKMVNVMATP